MFVVERAYPNPTPASEPRNLSFGVLGTLRQPSALRHERHCHGVAAARHVPWRSRAERSHHSSTTSEKRIL